MKIKSYLITGGNGFIGSSLVRRMVREGLRVRVLDNNIRGKKSRLKGIMDRVEIINADVRDKKAVLDACKGIDAVCHLAYLNGTEFFYTKPDLVLDIGVKGMVNIVDSCIKKSVKELILLSSSEVYQTPPVIPTDENVPLSIPDPINPRYSYGGGKIISELMAINYGRKYFDRTIIVRPHNVYGPDMGYEHVIPQFLIRMKRLCENAGAGSVLFPIQGTGRQTRAFIFIDDFVDAFMLVIKKAKHMGIYNIGVAEEMPIAKVALEAGAYFGKKVKLVRGEAPEGSVSRRCPDIEKIKRLGFKQKFSFKKGFKVTAKWYDDNADKSPFKARMKIDYEAIYSSCR